MGKTIFPEGLETSNGPKLSIDSVKLRNADTGIYEIPVEGDDYISPEQHGGIYGTVIRRYFGELASEEVVVASASILVNSKVLSVRNGTIRFLDNKFGTADQGQLKHDGASGDGAIMASVSTSVTIVSGWADYVPVTALAYGVSTTIVSEMDPTLLERVDTGDFEHAVPGVDYFSPDQHGGVHGKVIRRYIERTITTAGTQTLWTDLGIKGIISHGGQLNDASTAKIDAMGYVSSEGYGGIYYNNSTGGVTLRLGSSFDDVGDTLLVHVDYVLNTEPARSPSSRSLALMETVADARTLQRTDGAGWEYAEAEVDYFSPDQQGGIYGKIIRRFYEGTGVVGTVTLSSDASNVEHLVSQGGALIDSAGNQVAVPSKGAGVSDSHGRIVKTSGTLTLERGTSYDEADDVYIVWVDVALVDEPATVPEFKALSNTDRKNDVAIDPSVVQNATTKQFQMAEEGTEFFSPDQSKGLGNTVYRQFFSESAFGVVDASLISGITGATDLTVVDSEIRYLDTGRWYKVHSENLAGADAIISNFGQDTINLLVGTLYQTQLAGFVDYIKTSDGTDTEKPSKTSLSTVDPMVLQRVDDMTFETAVDGVEYFAPDQHGNVYGKVVRQYFTNKVNGDTFGTATKVVSVGTESVASGDRYFNENPYVQSTVRLIGTSGSGTLTMTLTADSNISGWVDYIPITAPTTRPTGQPFADPSSGLLKRVDNGKYELSQVEVEYIAAGSEQARAFTGGRVTCVRFDISAPTTDAWTVLPTQPSGSKKPIGARVQYVESGYTYIADGLSSADTVRFRLDSGDTYYYVSTGISDVALWLYFE